LTTVQRVTEKAREERDEARKLADVKARESMEKAEREFNKQKKELEPLKNTNPAAYDEQMDIIVERINNQIEAEKAKLDRDKEKTFRRIDNEMAAKIHGVQDGYRLLAVALPPIPPLLIAICVFFVRRSREREGVAESRLVK
jgi:ABC-2 type transport system permease protein